MDNAIYFKWLHRKNRFRNPESVLKKPEDFHLSPPLKKGIESYLSLLADKNISYTYPGHVNYPDCFYKMKEPPLFLEYVGEPIWKDQQMLAVVGSRSCHPLTRSWIQTELFDFVQQTSIPIVSGGAKGVDLYAHIACLKASVPTVVVIPSGVENIYQKDLLEIRNDILAVGGAIISEFEFDQRVEKKFFYFRNRLIAALSPICLIAQAQEKSGTMLTVHHALENGRVVTTLPAHPCQIDFKGNINLIKDGCFVISSSQDLQQLWSAECWSRDLNHY